MFQDLQTTFYDIYFAKKDLDSNGSWYEGPVVQIGASWNSTIRKFIPKKSKKRKRTKVNTFVLVVALNRAVLTLI